MELSVVSVQDGVDLESKPVKNVILRPVEDEKGVKQAHLFLVCEADNCPFVEGESVFIGFTKKNDGKVASFAQELTLEALPVTLGSVKETANA